MGKGLLVVGLRLISCVAVGLGLSIHLALRYLKVPYCVL